MILFCKYLQLKSDSWFWIQAAVLATVAVPPTALAAAPQRVERIVGAMGTELRVVVDATDRGTALGAAEAAIRAVAAAEDRLSTWSEGSELSRLNRAPIGTPVALSPLLARDLRAAMRCSAATAGAFSPGLGALVRAWGLRRGGRLPGAEQIESARRAADLAGLTLGPRFATRTREGFLVEEGGFGKGAGLDDGVAALARTGARGGLLDLGGQIALWGDARATVGIADPRHRDRTVLRLDVTSGSVATSGNSERGIEAGGQHLGHLLDPRTGRPSPDFGSVTIWALEATVADCLATGLYVLGPTEAVRWAADHAEVGIVLLEARPTGLVAHVSPSLRGRLSPVVEDLKLQWIELPRAVPGRADARVEE